MDAAIDMAFGREMDDAVNAIANDAAHAVTVGDISLDKAIAALVGQVGEIRRVAGVAQLVEVYDLRVRMVAQQVPDEIAADKAAPAGHKDLWHPCLLP